MLHTQIASFALTVLALALAGCGSSSKSETTTTAATTTAPTTTTTTTTETIAQPSKTTVAIAKGSPLSRTDWIAKGDVICARANGQLKSIAVKTEEELERVLPQAVAYDRAELAELRKLVPPTSKANDWHLILESVGNFAEDTARAVAYIQAKNYLAEHSMIRDADRSQKQLTVIAKRNGFLVCSHT